MAAGTGKKRRDDRREEKVGRDLRSRFAIRRGVESKNWIYVSGIKKRKICGVFRRSLTKTTFGIVT